MKHHLLAVAFLLNSVPVFAEEFHPHELTNSQIDAVYDDVKRGLRDPMSARFSDVHAVKEPNQMIHVCGWVNAKNGFGGYAGPTPFYVAVIPTDPPRTLLGFLGWTERIAEDIAKICRNYSVGLR